jgi:hypothetical protein
MVYGELVRFQLSIIIKKRIALVNSNSTKNCRQINKLVYEDFVRDGKEYKWL